ncbi:acyl-CoA dehydrogenase family protein [Phenylobacterium sp.]|jgi:alkylation response protein AidB-like acyl-CoA dehydrogenase|uniref:acyl-CoA dehydrogenase family protein n=1 Tax=Phenylobacterium sp. TaxID=1871053 RepID=UPI002F92B7D2
MDLSLSADDLAFRAQVRELIVETFPDGEAYEGTSQHEARWHAAMLARGWAANKWPVEFGGPGWTATQHFIWERETTAAGLPSQVGGMGMGMLAPILFAYGSPEQQARFLPDILHNRVRWCQGYSEPGAGSDLASLRTRAVLQGDRYLVTGEKIWTSNAHQADWMFCLTRTSDEPKKQAGITFLLLDMHSPGVEVHPIVSIDGRHMFNRVTFDDVAVPLENRVGREGEGWTVAKGLLTHERTGQAFVSLSLDLVRRIREAAAGLPGSRGEGSLLHDPGFAARLAWAEIELEALAMTELRTLSEVEAGAAPGAQSSLLKLKGTDIVQRMTEFFVECAGPYAAPWFPEITGRPETVGPDWAQPETVRYLEGRAASIAGGSDEIQRNIIAKHVLRL